MAIWHWIKYAFALSDMLSVMVAAPVSLISAWIIWARNDRFSCRDGWRQKILFAGVLVLSVSAALLALTLSGEWWAETSQSPTQRVLLNDLSTSGAICCMVAVLSSSVGKGRARLALAAGGFFGLFVYGIVTPFGIVP